MVAVGDAAATAAVGVGGVVPSLVDGSRTPYEVLGAGYAILAAVIFVAATALALGTLAISVVQP